MAQIEDIKRPNKAQINKDARRKQYLYLYFGIAMIGIIALLFSIIADESTAVVFDSKPKLDVPGESVNVSALWRQGAEEDIQTLVKNEKTLRTSMDELQQHLDRVIDDLEQSKLVEEQAAFELEILRIAKADQPEINKSEQEYLNEELTNTPPIVPEVVAISLVKLQDNIPHLSLDQTDIAELTEVTTEVISPTYSVTNVPSDSKDYIPSGSFMQAEILGGIDAPTGNTSRDNPHPVLLRISNQARLPNLVRRDLRECLVLAAGYGDISSERALLRTERMSCQRPDGSYFDKPIRGFIVGEDGRAGVRGKLVTKQGQILQRSLLAGIGEGFSEILRSRYGAQTQPRSITTTTPTVSSTVSITQDIDNTDYNDLARAGLAVGASSAASRLADYYIRLADRIHPIIEVGSGRIVDIVLQEGIDLGSPQALVQ